MATRRRRLTAALLIMVLTAVAANAARAHDLPGLAAEAEATRAYQQEIDTAVSLGLIPVPTIGVSLNEWPWATELIVCFWGGAPEARTQFMDIALDAIALTNLRLNPDTGDCPVLGAQVRVSFEAGSSWSVVGERRGTIQDENSPDVFYFTDANLNLENMGGSTAWSSGQIGTARHEFGHTLGLKHEHQNPDVDCGFIPFQDMIDQGLLTGDVDEIQNNYDTITMSEDLRVGEYDHDSIMHYFLDDERLFVDGQQSPCFNAGRKDNYSEGDQEFLKEIYPPLGRIPEPTLPVSDWMILFL